MEERLAVLDAHVSLLDGVGLDDTTHRDTL